MVDYVTVRRRAFSAAKAIGLTRPERLEFAEMILKVDVDTWDTLSTGQLARLVDALDGWHYIDTLLNQRPNAPAPPGGRNSLGGAD